MDETTHTIVALACIGISYMIGYHQGFSKAWGDGFREGAESAIDKIMASLKSEFGINIWYDVETGEQDEN